MKFRNHADAFANTLQYRTPGCVAAQMALTLLIALTMALPALGQQVVVDPYAAVDWQEFDQHKANLHTHSTQSDGQLTPSQVVDEYRARGFSILAITDHNLCTWPWTGFGTMERKGRALMGDRAAEREADIPSEERRNPMVYAYEDRDPEALGMVAIAGNEPSVHHHMGTYFIEYETRSREIEQTLAEVTEAGGLAVIFHPGRYWDPEEDGSISDEVINRYVTWYRDFDIAVGMEVINQAQRYNHDVRLWDGVLSVLMPDRPVWGFANNDMHRIAQLGRDWNVFLLDNLTEEAVRAAMKSGEFYFTTIGTHPEEVRDVTQTPVITAIDHDAEAGVITLAATSGGAPLPEDQYRWISNGEVVHTGPALRYRDTEGIGNYVRAEMTGAGGTTFTNPYGLHND